MRNVCSIQSLAFAFLLLSAVADASTSPMMRTEKEALYSLIRSFVGDAWNGSDLFPDPCGWTPIPGVSCDLFDGFWHVTAISIGPIQDNSIQCNPAAEFSPFLFEFRRLKSLSLFNCFARSTLMPAHRWDWEKLAGSLQTLELRSNPGLTGGIAAAIASLAKLRSLVMIENGLSGELPASLGNLSELKQLVLSGNGFWGGIPPSIGALKQLLILDLSRNSLNGSLPAALGGLASLLKLDLSSNSLDGQLPFELGELKNLTLLDLRHNRFSNGLPLSLLQMASLEEIFLSNNPIGGSLMESGWANLKSLMVLDFSNISLAGEIPESMAEMRRLRFLALNNNRLCGKIPANVRQMPCITAVYLDGNNLTGEIRLKKRLAASAWDNQGDGCLPAGVVGKGVGSAGYENGGPGSSDPYGSKTAMGGRDWNASGDSRVSRCDAGWWGLSTAEIVVGVATSLLLLL
ncbi:hypothetical protein ACLOJK_001463 [Asimina triloba]